jgi:N-acyl-D-aspartate/D-glutamate deacylase
MRLAKGAASEDAGVLGTLFQWECIELAETFTPATKPFTGWTVGMAASKLGKEPFDALLDIVIADELRTGLRPPARGDSDADWELRASVWQSPHTLIGASDAGAHLDMFCGAVYTTTLLGPAVRERRLLPIEQAVRFITDDPARLYGLRGRGRIAPGWIADLVLFDPDRIGPGPETTRQDLPGGAGRLYAEADGIEHVLVGGQEIVRRGTFIGDTPGRVLRSGRDTETVTVPGSAQRVS